MQRYPLLTPLSAGLTMKLALGFAVSACSWERFDEISADAPVVLLKKPDKLSAGFGVSLAYASLDERVQLISSGSPPRSPAAVFDLGSGESPVADAVNTGPCDNQATPCALASTLAGMGLARGRAGDEDKELCFALGLGKINDEKGLMVHCSDRSEYVLEVPEAAVEAGLDPFLEGQPAEPLTLAVDADERPFLAAGLGAERLSFYYAAGSLEPELLEPNGSAPEGFGATLAVLRAGDSKRIIAVGAPDADTIWLFDANDEGASPIACLEGGPDLARAMAAGQVDADEFDELVIADETNVTVLDGKALNDLPATDSSDCSVLLEDGTLEGAMLEEAVLATFDCGEDEGDKHCGGSDFGAALAVGDLDGDGDGEVIVGAPEMRVRDQDKAGAVLVYDGEGEKPWRHSDVQFISSAEAGDRLGRVVVAVDLGDRHIIAAGAPNSGKTALFYCSTVSQSEAPGKRCQ